MKSFLYGVLASFTLWLGLTAFSDHRLLNEHDEALRYIVRAMGRSAQ